MASAQLRMFGLPAEATGPVGPAALDPEVASLARALPPHVRFGTSSWSFPGWEGLVYDRRASEQALARHGLEAYARHPLLGAVGVDRTYHAPVGREVFERYAAAAPAGFRFLVKAHHELTTPWFAAARGPRPAGENPRFLDPGYAAEVVLAPLAGLGERPAILLLQFPPLNVPALGGPRAFAERLAWFLDALPPAPAQLAVELRNPELLGDAYAARLRERGVVHCLGAHPSMPPLREQAAALGRAHTDAPQRVIRWMLARRFDYAAAKERYRPFDRVVDADPETRAAIHDLVLEARDRPATVIVNNKAEGSSPLSIRALARAFGR